VKTKILLAVLLVVSLGVNAGAIIVLVKHGRSGRDVPCGWRANAMRGGYRLTKDQAEVLEKCRLEMIERTAVIRSGLLRHRQALLDLYRRDSVAEPSLDSVLALLVGEQIALEKEVFRHVREVRDRLDPGQRELLYRHLNEELCPARDAGRGVKCPHHK
jgi:hypothetical protein